MAIIISIFLCSYYIKIDNTLTYGSLFCVTNIKVVIKISVRHRNWAPLQISSVIVSVNKMVI